MAYKQGVTYIEGTWTPAITGGTSDPTVAYTTQSGKYTQVGDTVYAKATVVINTTSGGSGDLRVSLPLTSANDSNSALGTVFLDGVAYPTSASYIVISVPSNVSYGEFVGVKDNAASAKVQIGDIANGDTIDFTVVYNV